MSEPSNVAAIASNLVNITPVPITSHYKPSRFIAHAVTPDGATVIYNSVTGHHAAIPPQHKEELKRLLSRRGCSEPLSALGEYLLKHHYLVSSAADERAAFDIRFGNEHYRNDLLELILLSSEDCNFRCVYCSQEFKRGQMHPNVQKGILGLIQSRIKRLSELRISWFGGEPLMGWDAIEYLAPAIHEATLQTGIALKADITTNGYLLTAERSAQLLSWGVRMFQITLDGTESDHDAHRPLKDGGSTFGTILNNLISLQRTDTYFYVALRVNTDTTNAQRLGPLFDRLAQQFGQDDRFNLRIFPVGKWGGKNDDQLPVFCSSTDEQHNLVQLQLEAKAAGLHVESFAHRLQPSYVCYAARPYSFVIGSDGKVMKCTVLLDTAEKNIVGHLEENGSLGIDTEKYLAWVKPHHLGDSACQQCFFLPNCQGASCPLPRFVNERPCPPVKTHIQSSLRSIYALESQRGRANGC